MTSHHRFGRKKRRALKQTHSKIRKAAAATGKEVGLRSNDEGRVYSPMAFPGFAIPADTESKAA